MARRRAAAGACRAGRPRRWSRVIDEVVRELRRRLGGPFTTKSSPACTPSRARDWIFAIATRAAPGNPAAWDMPTVGWGGVRALCPRGDATTGTEQASPGERLDLSLLVVAVLLAGAADHDLVLLDRDLNGPVAGPVLGVDRVVLDGGIEPEPVSLLAVVERRLERTPPDLRRVRRPPRRPRRRRWPVVSLGLLVVVLVVVLVRSGPRRPRARRRSARRPRPGDRSRRRSRPPAPAPSGSVLVEVLALERLDLLDGHLELVRDPGVGASLAHPGADPVQFGPERSASHWPETSTGRLGVATASRRSGRQTHGCEHLLHLALRTSGCLTLGRRPEPLGSVAGLRDVSQDGLERR